MDNPIMFNPDGMTVRQVKRCADTVRWLYDSIDRYDAMPDGEDKEHFLANLLHHIRQGRVQMAKDA